MREQSSGWKDTGPPHGQSDTIRVKRARKYYSLPFSSINRGLKNSAEWGDEGGRQLARTFKWKSSSARKPSLRFLLAPEKQICFSSLKFGAVKLQMWASCKGMHFASSPCLPPPFTYVLLQEDHTDPGFHTRKIINSFIQPISSYTERICAQSCAAVGLEMGPTADSSVTTNRWPGL